MKKKQRQIQSIEKNIEGYTLLQMRKYTICIDLWNDRNIFYSIRKNFIFVLWGDKFQIYKNNKIENLWDIVFFSEIQSTFVLIP